MLRVQSKSHLNLSFCAHSFHRRSVFRRTFMSSKSSEHGVRDLHCRVHRPSRTQCIFRFCAIITSAGRSIWNSLNQASLGQVQISWISKKNIQVPAKKNLSRQASGVIGVATLCFLPQCKSLSPPHDSLSLVNRVPTPLLNLAFRFSPLNSSLVRSSSMAPNAVLVADAGCYSAKQSFHFHSDSEKEGGSRCFTEMYPQVLTTSETR